MRCNMTNIYVMYVKREKERECERKSNKVI